MQLPLVLQRRAALTESGCDPQDITPQNLSKGFMEAKRSQDQQRSTICMGQHIASFLQPQIPTALPVVGIDTLSTPSKYC